ncbi:LPS export ABC transporter periplasmic protein LptC [Marinomonas gallaica]|uniref:LPS export ABC transporter periplasmic protein LptC n=1 Tax=Marinomonas gallaica TaxID=1806667 RepID=UPI003CE5C36C
MLDFLKKTLNPKGIAGISALVIVLVAVFLLGNRPTLYILEEQKLSNAPDFFLEGVTVKSFDLNGQLTETVTADIANHYTQKQTDLDHPVITRIDGNSSSIASAETGFINDTSNSFTLSKSAQITRFKNETETAKIKANTITYNDESQTIVGTQQSQLITPQGVTKSDIISFDLAKETAILSGGVTGQYETPTH